MKVINMGRLSVASFRSVNSMCGIALLNNRHGKLWQGTLQSLTFDMQHDYIMDPRQGPLYIVRDLHVIHQIDKRTSKRTVSKWIDINVNCISEVFPPL